MKKIWRIDFRFLDIKAGSLLFHDDWEIILLSSILELNYVLIFKSFISGIMVELSWSHSVSLCLSTGFPYLSVSLPMVNVILCVGCDQTYSFHSDIKLILWSDEVCKSSVFLGKRASENEHTKRQLLKHLSHNQSRIYIMWI